MTNSKNQEATKENILKKLSGQNTQVISTTEGFMLKQQDREEVFRLKGEVAYGRGGKFDLRFIAERYACLATVEEPSNPITQNLIGLGALLDEHHVLRETSSHVFRNDSVYTTYTLDTPEGRLWLAHRDGIEAWLCGGSYQENLSAGGLIIAFNSHGLSHEEQCDPSIISEEEYKRKSTPRTLSVSPQVIYCIQQELRRGSNLNLQFIPKDYLTNPSYLQNTQ